MDFLEHAHMSGKKFLNPVPTELSTGGSILLTMWKFFTNKKETIPKHVLGPFSTDVAVYKTAPASGLRITWIGHSSLLIEMDGKRILTDPVWSERASFASFIGPQRFFAPPLSLHELPALDAIIISHDHYDHLDKAVIRQLANTTVPFYCSLKVGRYLEQWGVHKSRITTQAGFPALNILAMHTVHLILRCLRLALIMRTGQIYTWALKRLLMHISH